MDQTEYGLIDRSLDQDGVEIMRMSIEQIDRAYVPKRVSQAKFKTPRPEASPSGTKEYLRVSGAPNGSNELS